MELTEEDVRQIAREEAKKVINEVTKQVASGYAQALLSKLPDTHVMRVGQQEMSQMRQARDELFDSLEEWSQERASFYGPVL